MGHGCSSIFGYNFPETMDRARWPNSLTTKISRRHSNGFCLLGLRQRESLLKEIRDVEDCRESVTAATVTTEMIQRRWLELDFRLEILMATKGAHVEVL
ncbi:hypothetical protein AVEN_192455-1 [Araneus ventricosus]|uniref:Uncharacterized protein n=1 Tax=Araneus ventricosus TaxID=182803 RepID=A0A4Y2NR11_ARAVE|nr:hypothetical protein AVEN_192455-1 [Araneus ventricosus]